jgi:hypothetical protein
LFDSVSPSYDSLVLNKADEHHYHVISIKKGLWGTEKRLFSSNKEDLIKTIEESDKTA